MKSPGLAQLSLWIITATLLYSVLSTRPADPPHTTDLAALFTPHRLTPAVHTDLERTLRDDADARRVLGTAIGAAYRTHRQ